MPINTLSLLLVVLYVGYPIISFFSIQKIFQKLIEGSKITSIFLLMIFVFFNGTVIALLGVYSYGVWWIFVLPLYLVAPIVGIIGGILLLKKMKILSVVQPINVLFAVVLIGSFTTSPFLSRGIESLCDTVTRNQARMLISGIEEYKNQKGSYPENISTIYPDYIDMIPTASCLTPYKLFDRLFRNYGVEYCNENSLLLTVHSMDLDSILIYNFPYHQWTQYESDDYCGCICPEINTP